MNQIYSCYLFLPFLQILTIFLSKLFCLNRYSFQSRKHPDEKDPGAARVRLQGVRGYLVEFPLYFLDQEDLRPPVNSSEFYVPEEVFK